MSVEQIVTSALNRTGPLNKISNKNSTISVTKNVRYKIITLVAAIADFLSILIASILSKKVYLDFFLQSNQSNLNFIFLGIVGSILCLLLFAFRGHYRHDKLVPDFKHLLSKSRALFFSFLFLIFIAFAFKVAENYSRGWLFLWFGISLVFIIATKYFVYKLIISNHFSKYFSKKIAILGHGPDFFEFVNDLKNDFPDHLPPKVYELGNNQLQLLNLADFYQGNIIDLLQDGLNNSFDQIIIYIPTSDHAKIENVLKTLSILPSEIDVCLGQSDFDIVNPKISTLHNNLILTIYNKPIAEWGLTIKTIVDYFISLTLLFLLLPLMLIIAVAIKIDSKGPVFFFQTRHGFNHRSIKIIKFRTMFCTEDKGLLKQASKNDSRVTFIGRFLRRTSLDEIPQLINVLKGEMSLVGPRPHAIAHNEFYSQRLEFYANRHKVKPGITGLAQIRGYRGETQKIEYMKLRADADIEYIENWSIWLDLGILVITPFKLIFSKNAY